MSAADVITIVLVPAGALFSALGALGLLRFSDLFTRLHASTKPHTIGVLLILLGTAPRLGASGAALILVALFQLATAPVIAHTVGSAAYRTGAVDPGRLIVDETDGEAGP